MQQLEKGTAAAKLTEMWLKLLLNVKICANQDGVRKLWLCKSNCFHNPQMWKYFDLGQKSSWWLSWIGLKLNGWTADVFVPCIVIFFWKETVVMDWRDGNTQNQKYITIHEAGICDIFRTGRCKGLVIMFGKQGWRPGWPIKRGQNRFASDFDFQRCNCVETNILWLGSLVKSSIRYIWATHW